MHSRFWTWLKDCPLLSRRAHQQAAVIYLPRFQSDIQVLLTVSDRSGQDKSQVIYDPKNVNNWVRVGAYGGSFFNRIVQGFSRDLLVDSCLLPLDAAGATIVLHTHDDGNIEVDAAKGEGARAAMERMMRTPPAWAAGFPLYAECKLMRRYGK